MTRSLLGPSELSVSRIGLGTMMIGWRMDRADAERVMATALDRGINLIDSSVSYARGRCHEILGTVLQSLGCRERVVLATKVGGTDGEESAGVSAYSAANMVRQCERALRQLRTDRIELLQLHWPDPGVPIEEPLGALATLIARGLVRYGGVCNYTPPEWLDAVRAAATIDRRALVSNQVQHNLLARDGGSEMQAAADSAGLGLVTWGPLASGLLSAWYVHHQAPRSGSRIADGRERDARERQLAVAATRDLLQRAGLVARRRALSVSQVAVAWILAQRRVNTVLLGPSTPDQCAELADLTGDELQPDDLAVLEAHDQTAG